MSISWQVKQIMHSRQYISNVEGLPKFCIDLEADWLLILGEVGGKSPGCTPWSSHPGDSWEWPNYISYQSENCRK